MFEALGAVASLTKVVQTVPTAALQAIEDPNTRTVLQTLVDGWQMRNGQSGSGDNAFLSLADLKRKDVGNALAMAVAGPISGAVTNIQSPLVGLVRDLRASVLTSALYIKLTERVELLDGPEDLPGSVNAKIKDERLVRITNDSALASAINYVWGKVGTNSALVADGATISINNLTAVATKFEQVQTAVTDPVTGQLISSTAIRQELTTSNSAIDGLKGQYTVKIDLNGYVAGFGLAASSSLAGVNTSEFIIVADKFAVVTPGQNPRVPFVIGQVQGQTLVGIDGSLVVDQSIVAGAIDTRGLTIKNNAGQIILGAGTALNIANISGLGAFATLNQLTLNNIDTYIGRLAVDTLYIANEAVTMPRGAATNAEMGVSGNHTNDFTQMSLIQTVEFVCPPTVDSMTVFVQASCSWYGSSGGDTYTTVTWENSGSETQWDGNHYYGEASLGTRVFASVFTISPNIINFVRTPRTYHFRMYAAGDGTVGNRSIAVYGAKK